MRKIRKLSKNFETIISSRDPTVKKIFHSIVRTPHIPDVSATFYIRTRREGTVLMLTCNGKIDSTNILIRSFSPWNDRQLWCFAAIEKRKGLLIHPSTGHILTAFDGMIQTRSIRGCLDESSRSHLFHYTQEGCWIHLETGLRLSYIMISEAAINVCYDFDIVPAEEVMKALIKRGIFWSNTNRTKSRSM